MSIKLNMFTISVLAAGVSASSLAAAQPGADNEPVKRSNRLIEEVVVTAQKREENAQDVPIAITAFSGEKLDAFGIESAQDLERITPGLTVTNAVGFNVAYLRGVGTDAFLPGADPSVPFYLDGVALLGAQGSSDTLGKVERVEVLKGPQGTLFGRNATGGAVNIITPAPSDEFFGSMKLEVGDYGEQNGLIFLNLPIVDGLAASVSLFSTEHDNYYTNDVGPIIDVYSRGGRAKIRWDISDTLALTLSGSVSEGSGNSGLAFENTRTAPVLGAAFPQDPKADRHVRFDSLAGATSESYLVSFIVDWQLPGVDIKMIGSDQEVDAPFVQADFDKSELPIINIRSIVQLAEQQTLELQFLSNEDSFLSENMEWVAGIYYLSSSGGFDPIAFDVAPNALTTLPIPLADSLTDLLGGLLNVVGLPNVSEGVRLLSGGVLDSESYSVYAQSTFFLSESMDLTFGLRYQEEERNLLKSRLATVDGDGDEILLRSDDVPTLTSHQLSPKIAFQWRPFDDETQIYASWGRAFKSPTYNTVNLLDAPESVEEEQVESYELGIKTDLLDGNLRLNAAVFYIEQQNLLTGFVALASGGVVSYDNAGDSEISGAEADFVWTPMPNWNPGLAMFGAVSVLDSEYTSYPDGRGYDEDTGLAFGEGGTFPLPARDFSGNRIVRTPELTYTFGVNQSITVGDGAIEIGVDTYYNDGFYFLPQNSDLYARESYNLYNARLSYFYNPWGLQLTVFGENVLDEVYNEVVFVDDFGRNQVLNSPRVVGARVNWDF